MKETMFDLDSEVIEDSLDGKSPYQKQLDKALNLCLRERFDEALRIYESILEEDFKCTEAYIGVLRAHSLDYTLLEGEAIDKDVRLVEKMIAQYGLNNDDRDYRAYINRRNETFAKRKADADEAAERKADAEEAERKFNQESPHCIHLCQNGEWKDIYFKSEDKEHFYIRALALESGNLLKLNLNGDWRGASRLVYDEPTKRNFSSDGTYDDNILVKNTYAYDINVKKSQAGPCIEIEVSDPGARQWQIEQIEAENRRKEELRKTHYIHLQNNKIWKDVPFETEDEDHFYIRGIALEKADMFKVNLNGDWRGSKQIAYDESSRLNFCSDRTFNDNIVVNNSQVYDIKVTKSNHGQSITLLVSDPDARSRQIKENKALEEQKRRKEEEAAARRKRIDADAISQYGFPFEEGVTVITYDIVYNMICSGRAPAKQWDIVIPRWVKKIGNGAFASCQYIRSIKIPWFVGEVGESAFANSGLCEAVVDSAKTKLAQSAFSGAKSLKKVTLEFEIRTLPERCFFQCSSLEEIKLPSMLEDIGEYAFYGCASLKSITIPGHVRKIGDCAFYKCDRMRSLQIGESVRDIGESAFSYCSSLEKVVINARSCSLDSFVFRKSENIEQVEFAGSKEQFNASYKDFYFSSHTINIKCRDGTLTKWDPYSKKWVE